MTFYYQTSSWNSQPQPNEETINFWKKFNPKTLIYFAKKDSVVGNALDEIFIKKAQEKSKNLLIKKIFMFICLKLMKSTRILKV